MRDQAHLSRRALAAALPIAALAGTTRPAAAAVPALPAAGDATLLDLGRRWHVAWSALRAHDRAYARIADADMATLRRHDVVGDRLFAEEQVLYDAVMATPSRSLAGLALKAQALARAFDAAEPGIAAVEAALEGAADMEAQAALSFALDAMRIGGTHA